MNLGIKNEEEIIRLLNHKKIKELNSNFKNELRKEFPDVDENSIIQSFNLDNKHKSDFCMIINDKKYGVSVKSGIANSVHEEYITTFLEFLKSIGVSERTLNIIKFYHYGEEYIDKLGVRKMSLGEIKYRFFKYIMEANNELSNPVIIYKVAKRVLINGISTSSDCPVDFLYYGTRSYGTLINKNDLLNYVCRIRCMELDSIHIGPFSLQPKSRKSPIEGIDESYKLRDKIQLKWHSLITDIQRMKVIRDAKYCHKLMN